MWISVAIKQEQIAYVHYTLCSCQDLVATAIAAFVTALTTVLQLVCQNPHKPDEITYMLRRQFLNALGLIVGRVF
jgi:hypothetical protein